ncbi:MAG: regulatory iron-sulfur-containing complex subunit RicT [Bacteroidota bacterium]|nr:regulatory iron-sulfur-containing complex subunit RicT [Bacteroidota bacterium]
MDNQYICCTRGCFNATGELPDKEPKPLTGCNKLDTCNWLDDIPAAGIECDLVEVRFKNTRKGYYKNVNKLRLIKGDIIAVEASPGHDIGVVSLTGELARRQMKRNGISFVNEDDIKKIYRKAKGVDLEKWYQAIELEMPAMLKAREAAVRLNLNMKIGDVEYQGDKTKAIFYYISDDRVDFRELIKVYAEEFRVRIEMKQIGARQEAGRTGGIGTCGRELCCSTWLTNFVSVTTNSARYQEVSLNPQKLAGQCGKLKCCLNYELKTYLDAQQDFPETSIALEIFDGTAFHQKTDIFRRIMWYSFSKDEAVNLTPVSVDRVKEIIELNKKGIKVKSLLDAANEPVVAKPLDYQSPVGSDSITRFEDSRNKDRRKKKKKGGNRNGNPEQSQGQNAAPEQTSTAPQNSTPNQGPRPNPNQNRNRGNNPNRNITKKPRGNENKE